MVPALLLTTRGANQNAENDCSASVQLTHCCTDWWYGHWRWSTIVTSRPTAAHRLEYHTTTAYAVHGHNCLVRSRIVHKHRRRRADAKGGSSMRCLHVAAMGVGCSTASLADCICDAVGFIVGDVVGAGIYSRLEQRCWSVLNAIHRGPDLQHCSETSINIAIALPPARMLFLEIKAGISPRNTQRDAMIHQFSIAPSSISSTSIA